jgi:hypothetical protein
MAQKVVVTLTDDLDGTEAAETVAFGLDGQAYEIDLSEANATALRDALAPYVASARRSGLRITKGTSGKAVPSQRKSAEAKTVRAWAKENGHDVPDRGRIPASVVEAYEAAN